MRCRNHIAKMAMPFWVQQWSSDFKNLKRALCFWVTAMAPKTGVAAAFELTSAQIFRGGMDEARAQIEGGRVAPSIDDTKNAMSVGFLPSLLDWTRRCCQKEAFKWWTHFIDCKSIITLESPAAGRRDHGRGAGDQVRRVTLRPLWLHR